MSATKAYYVTMIRDTKVAWLLGPFSDHASALARVADASSEAVAIDPRAHFDAFGTTGLALANGRTAPPGVLNERMGFRP